MRRELLVCDRCASEIRQDIGKGKASTLKLTSVERLGVGMLAIPLHTSAEIDLCDTCYAEARRWLGEPQATAAVQPEPVDAGRVEPPTVEATGTDPIRRHIATKLAQHGHDPAREAVFVPIPLMTRWLSEVEAKPLGPRTATPRLRKRSIEGLRYGRSRHGRGWIWTGGEPGKPATPVRVAAI